MDAAAEIGRNPVSNPSRGTKFSGAYGDRGIFIFPSSADHEQDWQPYPVAPYSAKCDDHTYIHAYSHMCFLLCFSFCSLFGDVAFSEYFLYHHCRFLFVWTIEYVVRSFFRVVFFYLVTTGWMF